MNSTRDKKGKQDAGKGKQAVASNGQQPMKNPFKKKRGEGWIPPNQREPEEEGEVQSIGEYSKLH